MNLDKLTIEAFKTSDKAKFEEARSIRDVVFIQEQKVDERDEFDEFEDESLHYIMYENSKPIGTARWRRVGNKVKLERFAIIKEARGKKYGETLVNRVVKDASEERKKMYMHAQLKAIPLYERCGFRKVGEQFSECDILHYRMEMG